MPILHVAVAEKIATFIKRDGAIVCGNSDYKIVFTFDSEWNDYAKKTARFIWNGTHVDVEFEGTECAVPIIKNADEVEVGVYAGDLETTTHTSIKHSTTNYPNNLSLSKFFNKLYHLVKVMNTITVISFNTFRTETNC